MAVLDDRGDDQRQAHLASAEYHGVHGVYDMSAGHKFAAANRYSRCKNRIEAGWKTRYFPNAVYPRGFVGGNARSVHFFTPHFEHRIRFATSSSRASQPHSRPSVRGSAVRSWPHPAHLSTKVYW